MTDFADPLAPISPRSGRWQIGIRTLFLLMAVVAVWLAVVINRRQNTHLESRIRAMQPIARELIVDDPGKIAVVRLDDLWMDESRWDVYLPTGNYRFCVATREIVEGSLAPVARSAPLAPGRHRIRMDIRRKGKGWQIPVLLDGTGLFTVEETGDWARSSSTGGGQYPISTQFPADKPRILYHRRYMPEGFTGLTTQESKGPTEGLMMWIEPVAGPEPAP